MSIGAATAATVGFVLTILVLERVHIVLYPDVFPGRTYIDEDGRRYVYEKHPSTGGYSLAPPQSSSSVSWVDMS